MLPMLFLMALAIENMADILTTNDLLEPYREFFANWPVIGKLSTCKYCQMFWLSVLCFGFWMPPSWVFFILAVHRTSFLISEFYDRYVNRAPLHLYMQQAKDENV